MVKQPNSDFVNCILTRPDVTGAHTFAPPNFDAGDQRGPCPGLNALANHNYLPHNGVADIPTIIQAVNKVYSMSLDLGAFLAIFGTVFDGNPLSTDPGYSIGGYSPDAQNILDGAGILGTPMGLSGSHNKYESDVSPTRGDLYTTGNSYKVILSRFIDYYNVLPRDTNSDEQFKSLADFHYQRYQQSLQTNPYFFYSPFAGILVSPAGYSFPARMMSNHSAQYPTGYLDPETFKSFFAISGPEGQFVYTEGHERIPDNWYRRPASEPFSIPAFLGDVVDHALKHPQLLSFGGNLGAVNTFAGVDVGNLTKGVFDFADLTDPNKLFCLLLQITQAAGPDLLGTTFSRGAIGKAFEPLADKIQDLLYGTTCPQLTSVDWAEFDKYPGYSQQYNGYLGKLTGDDGDDDLVGNTVGAVQEQVTDLGQVLSK